MTSPIKIVATQEIIQLRHEILRPGKPIETCFFEGDYLPTTKHLAFYENEIVIGATSLYLINHINLNELATNCIQFQMRGMAISNQHQKKGIGQQLINFTEDYLKNTNKDTVFLWFNARETAVPFYEKFQYKKIGNLFEIPDVGSHYMMYKILS